MGTIEMERDRRGVATLWLSNRGRLNALSNAMVFGLCEALAGLAEDETCRAVVLRGRDGVFCAGRDLKDLGALQDAPADEVSLMYDFMERMNRAVYFCPHPVVAVVERYALGIATMMVSWADIAVAAEDAVLGYPEVRHGIVPYGAVPTMLNAMPRKAVAELLLTGRKIDAAEAVRLGIVSRAVPAGGLEQAVDDTLADLVAGDTTALSRIKLFLRECEGLGYSDGIVAATRLAKAGTGRDGTRNGIDAFLDRKTRP